MRFINDFDWKKTMQYGWRRILRALVRPFAAIRLKFRRLSNPNTLVNTVVTDVQAEVKKAVSKKPESLDEYLLVGRYYAAKKLIIGILILVILLPILYLNFSIRLSLPVFYGKRSRSIRRASMDIRGR